MAFGKKPSSKSPSKSVSPVSKSAPVSTPVRNSAVPPRISAMPVAKKVVTQEQIAIRAFEISRSSRCGSELDNWFLAERELKGI